MFGFFWGVFRRQNMAFVVHVKFNLRYGINKRMLLDLQFKTEKLKTKQNKTTKQQLQTNKQKSNKQRNKTSTK